MSLRIYKVSDYETTHEREQFDKLCSILKDKYDKHDDIHLLIANPSFENRDIDAVFIKRDAITVLEFKNYGGDLKIAENGDWKCNEDVTVKGGSLGKNPYMQVKINKTGLCSVLNTWFYKPNVNLSHVTAIVLFYQPINVIASVISPSVNTWFKVTDMNGVGNQLHNFTSKSINYTNEDLNDLIVKLNLEDCIEYKTNVSQIEIKEEIKKAQEAESNFKLPQNLEIIKNNIEKLGFKTVKHFPIPERKGFTRNINQLNLSANALDFLKKKVNGEIWEHQYDSIESAINGNNVCIATSTSSGKSYVFYTVGIETLAKNPNAKLIAIYPLRALATQQEENWNKALAVANLSHIKVGKIDGSNSGQLDARKSILNECNVLIITPDTIHMFLLGKINDPRINQSIKNFLSHTELIIIDEIHTYTGVFGSNSAYLFRRLNHSIDVLKGRVPKYIAASATINDPETHLKKMVGSEFIVITNDTSPKRATDIILVEPHNFAETLSNMNKLVGYFNVETIYKGITFLDSRKMVEQIAGGVNRQLNKEINDELLKEFNLDGGNMKVYPHRSGFENKDSEEIQRKLMNGSIKSIVSTSALEMGLDIKELDLAILLGIPYSATSFYQRIGRVGRVGCQNDGLIIIVNDNSVRSNSIFKDPKRLFEIPMAEGALYLENENLQSIHALCFAEENGEFDATAKNGDFSTNINFPASFIKICYDIRNRNISNVYEQIRNNGGTYPQYTYPIRDLEPQFKVFENYGRPNERALGNLSRSQVHREAYPGAVYYYNTDSFRVTKVDLTKNIITVRREKQYFTTPSPIPTMVFPQLRDDKIFNAKMYGALKVIECEIQVTEKIESFKETRGTSSLEIKYPLEGKNVERVYYTPDKFQRNYKTTGTLLSHNVLDNNDVKSDVIAQLIFEIFLLHIPFEKQDVNFVKSKYRENTLGFEVNSRFIAIYDQSFGGLQLTSRLCEFQVLKKVFDKAWELVNDSTATFSFVDGGLLNNETIEAIKTIRDALNNECVELNFNGLNNLSVIKPGNSGIYNGNEVTIREVISTEKGLKYKIIITIRGASAVKFVSIDEIEPCVGSEMGVFNFDTYEVE